LTAGADTDLQACARAFRELRNNRIGIQL
jgi:hypothetical protein